MRTVISVLLLAVALAAPPAALAVQDAQTRHTAQVDGWILFQIQLWQRLFDSPYDPSGEHWLYALNEPVPAGPAAIAGENHHGQLFHLEVEQALALDPAALPTAPARDYAARFQVHLRHVVGRLRTGREEVAVVGAALDLVENGEVRAYFVPLAELPTPPPPALAAGACPPVPDDLCGPPCEEGGTQRPDQGCIDRACQDYLEREQDIREDYKAQLDLNRASFLGASAICTGSFLAQMMTCAGLAVIPGPLSVTCTIRATAEVTACIALAAAVLAVANSEAEKQRDRDLERAAEDFDEAVRDCCVPCPPPPEPPRKGK